MRTGLSFVVACFAAPVIVAAIACSPALAEPDLANGKTMFFAGGCASCHAAPASSDCENPKTAEKFNLVGGRCLKTPFGTFYVPNITPDKETGIGNWTIPQFIKAMREGVSPSGEHYYPAFPYTSYQRMAEKDLVDLKSFLDTLPAIKSDVRGHDLSFPFNRRIAARFQSLLPAVDSRGLDHGTGQGPDLRGAVSYTHLTLPTIYSV